MRRIGIDTGGTFTDLVCIEDGKVIIEKQLSTPGEPALAVLNVLNSIGGIKQRKEITYGSTIATNAILERRGARVALVATEGFEDVIFIGRQDRPDLYSLYPKKPEPLVGRDMVFGVKERTLATGEIMENIAGLPEVVRSICRVRPEAIAICLLHSYAEPKNEQFLAKVFSESFPRIPVTLSSDILPEYREFERTSTTVLNAYVQPLVGSHLEQIGGAKGPGGLRIMQSNGGSISVSRAREEPVKTVLSGPAGGVIGAYHMARLAGFDRIITFDMGGTSTDVSLCSGRAHTTSEYSISGLPLRIPVLDIHTVGAGGGSIVHRDTAGGLHVGPRSAGASPGPVCFGKGGSDLTVTDANLILGRLRGHGFLGGRMNLQREEAYRAMEALASEMNIDTLELAEGIIRIANTAMQRAVMAISVQRGHDPRDFTLTSFGGAGGLHACELSRELGIGHVMIPRNPGVLSAFGMIISDVKKDYSHPLFKTDEGIGYESLVDAFEPLELRGIEDLREEGFEDERIVLVRSLDMRYRRQSYELNVPFSESFLPAFHESHFKRYGHCHREEQVEIVNLRLEGVGITDKPPIPSLHGNSSGMDDSVLGESQVYFDGMERDALVYERDGLAAGDAIDGTALVTEYTSTTLIPPGYRAVVDRYGDLVICEK